MAGVSVDLKTAQKGLPAICAMTGERADGAVPMKIGRSWVRWTSPSVAVPLSEPVFRRWSQRQNIHIKARAVASALTAIGVVIAFRNGLLAAGVLAAAVAIHLVDLWAERTGKQARPDLLREGATVQFARVHDRFAEAVVEMGGTPLSDD